MNGSTRALAALAAAGLAVPLWAGPASAESATDVPAAAAYFNSAGTAKPEQSPAKPPNPIASVDGVGPGNLGVAGQNGREDKASFLFFSLSTVPSDATITKAVLTVPLAPADNANVRLNSTPEKVAACAVEGSAFTNDDDGEALSMAPERKCEVAKAVGTGDDTAYVFDVTAHAIDWLATTNDGVALTRDPEKTDSFQVVFTKEATLAVEFTPAASTDAAVLDTATTDTVTTDLGATSGGSTLPTDAGTSSFGGGGFDSGSASAAIPGGSFDTATAAPLTGELPAAPAPETATDEPIVAAAAAGSGPIEVLSPTVAFWLAAVVLAGVLGFLSLVMGDRTPPAAAAGARPSPLTRALSAPAGARPSLLASRSA